MSGKGTTCNSRQPADRVASLEASPLNRGCIRSAQIANGITRTNLPRPALRRYFPAVRLLRIDILRGAALHGGAGCLLAIALLVSGCDRPTESSAAESSVPSAIDSATASKQTPGRFVDVVSTPTRGIIEDAESEARRGSSTDVKGVLKPDVAGGALDFGTMQQGRSARRVLLLRNTDLENDVTLKEPSTSCGCVSVLLTSGAVVPAGGVLPVEVVLEAEGTNPTVEQTIAFTYQVGTRSNEASVSVVVSARTVPPLLAIVPEIVIVKRDGLDTRAEPLKRRVYVRGPKSLLDLFPNEIVLGDEPEVTVKIAAMSADGVTLTDVDRVIKAIDVVLRENTVATRSEVKVSFVGADAGVACTFRIVCR